MKKAELTRRSIAGLLYVTLLLAAFYFYARFPWLLWAVFLLFYFVIVGELTALMQLDKRIFYPLAHGMGLMTLAFPLSLFFGGSYFAYGILAWAVYLLAGFVYVWLRARKQAFRYLTAFWYAYLPFLLTILPVVIVSPLYVFIVLWFYDSLAYLIGSRWGKHKLAPRISPGKTWEGLIGGTVLTLAVLLAVRYGFPAGDVYSLPLFPQVMDHWWQTRHLMTGLPAWQMFILVLWIIVWGTLGDLYESYLKRRAGVKDSGNIMPGHGGLLDRLDSFMMVQMAMLLTGIVFTLIYFTGK